MSNRTTAWTLSALLALSSAAEAAITFTFTYQDVIDHTGFGFDDASLGATRRATVEAVGSYFNTVLVENGAAQLHWGTSLNLPSSSLLGSMGALYYVGAGVTDGFVFKHITTGIDPDGNAATVDGQGQMNFGLTWNSGLAAPSGSENDLFSVVLHEVTHSLGFAALMASDGGYVSGLNGTRSTFTSFLSGPHGALIDGAGTFVGDAADLTSGQMVFTGANAKAANGGADVPIYSPATFSAGSSLSHLAASLNGAMNPTYTTGTMERSLIPVEVAMLKDIGYEVVPEPQAFALSAGLGVLAFAGLRRWQRQA